MDAAACKALSDAHQRIQVAFVDPAHVQACLAQSAAAESTPLGDALLQAFAGLLVSVLHRDTMTVNRCVRGKVRKAISPGAYSSAPHLSSIGIINTLAFDKAFIPGMWRCVCRTL